ncbi:hypothetical protein [Ramlibacter rhizophilus]|uniref:Uncharacterized protein n=1 Tax=Ramlibacter rhizophilus TaxID=1781167 RepID=A0A4Z0BPT7_9BURK|nr:hypothetical protein [Ramlibacter rhizophilus]TFZ01336.1 hypothetical protein EZ242_08115 [Ramlibacter rhizophilus]
MQGDATRPPGLIPTPDLRAVRAQGDALPAACMTAWQTTLALMTAYGRESAPAEKLLLARRIERELAALATASVEVAPSWHESFQRLGRRWRRTSQRLAAEPAVAAKRLHRAGPRRSL